MENAPGLIYDVGMHDGSDTAYYLHKGYKVIAIDANPELIQNAQNLFRSYIDRKMLVLLNVAISNQEGPASFSISKNDVWSSLDDSIAGRDGQFSKTIAVEAKKLGNLFTEYGTPCYCKIDIEGYDAVALQSLSANDLPQYISVETESIGENAVLTDNEALYTLELLHNLGYDRFTLVDQASLTPLIPGTKFYTEQKINMSLPARGLRYIRRKLGLNRERNYRTALSEKFGFPFKRGATGPWGNEIEGEWYDYDTAREMLLQHRKEYFAIPGAISFGFWCDWHAKKD